MLEEKVKFYAETRILERIMAVILGDRRVGR